MATPMVYFSRAGENYASGEIVDLDIGNTRIIAETIHDNVPDSDLFRISTVRTYAHDYKSAALPGYAKLASNRSILLSYIRVT